ncbi:hypothetical protein EMIHUDRAFT_224385 [Emiliania huxleyi CCMP1516]|uniref:Uncharacterized protein n=2 Tax=Emiliania huxleyi TaxID=2903 RepID=A0A0D3KS66_EMIH1|nr:hypothetical protein EMIHUDRAFT_224385 [Emiliania huxleyi CCMP1516]EOD38601.1 hypothetical protein EMIHUDRAFT_224385 [Emiliania huxleyi CCMP1516]|eukprot:XP_005791030.1 hypothetical protein EMIHUDRAFT_224385 [Emiliania huxleyi CCMP1516]
MAPPFGLFDFSLDRSPIVMAYGCMRRQDRAFHNTTHACGGSSGEDPVWRLGTALHDALHIVLLCCVIVGFGACMPRRRSWLSAVGNDSLWCYLLHIPLTPLVQSATVVVLLDLVDPEPTSPLRGLAFLALVVYLQFLLSRRPDIASVSRFFQPIFQLWSWTRGIRAASRRPSWQQIGAAIAALLCTSLAAASCIFAIATRTAPVAPTIPGPPALRIVQQQPGGLVPGAAGHG